MNKKDLVTLVIEDNDMFRRLAVDMLNGYTVYSATTAVDGLKKFKITKPNITFIDINLPDGSGQNLLSDIRAIYPDAFVVMLTASNLQKDVKESLEKGARGYIIKPFSRQKIKESIEQYYFFTKQNDKIKGMKK